MAKESRRGGPFGYTRTRGVEGDTRKAGGGVPSSPQQPLPGACPPCGGPAQGPPPGWAPRSGSPEKGEVALKLCAL